MIALGLGSNQGDRLGMLRRALRLIGQRGFRVLAVSPLYQSDALLPPGAPPGWSLPFLNLAARVETDLEPREALTRLKRLEAELGRVEHGRWAPREIDIDILCWNETRIESPELRVPHPGLPERPFALLPLADLARERGGAQGVLRSELGRMPGGWSSGEAPFHTRRAPFGLTEWVGVLNLTPDSFSDAGQFAAADRALARAHDLVEAGATVLDWGAESTRPGALPLSPREEWARLEPVIDKFAYPKHITMSLDTRHPETARRAVASGRVQWLNDVTGFESPEMRRALAESGCQGVLMHSLGVPPTRERVLAPDQDPIEALLYWGEERIALLEGDGVTRERLILDPGIGFGKSAAQAWAVLRGASRLRELGLRVLIGHSRKSFLSEVTARQSRERDLETAALSVHLIGQGIDYLRVHDVEMNARAARVFYETNGVCR